RDCGDEWDEGVAHRVTHDDPALAGTLRPCGADVIGVQLIEHRGPHVAAVTGEPDEDQDHARADEMVEVVLHAQPEVRRRPRRRLAERRDETLWVALAVDVAVPAPLENQGDAEGDPETGDEPE